LVLLRQKGMQNTENPPVTRVELQFDVTWNRPANQRTKKIHVKRGYLSVYWMERNGNFQRHFNNSCT